MLLHRHHRCTARAIGSRGNLSMKHDHMQASDRDEDDELLIEEELVTSPPDGISMR